MVDIAKFIVAKSDQLNAADIIGKPLTIKIREVRYNPEREQQQLEIFYEGDNGKPWKPAKTTGRVLTHFWGTETDNYIGRYVRLVYDGTVKFGGEVVGGIRIGGLSHIPEKTRLRLPVSRGKYSDHVIDVIRPQEQQPQPAQEPLVIDIEAERIAATNLAHQGTTRLVEAYWKKASKAVRTEWSEHRKAEWEAIKAIAAKADQDAEIDAHNAAKANGYQPEPREM